MNGPIWRRLEGLAYADLRQIAAVLAVMQAANSSVEQGLGAVRARLRQIEEEDERKREELEGVNW